MVKSEYPLMLNGITNKEDFIKIYHLTSRRDGFHVEWEMFVSSCAKELGVRCNPQRKWESMRS